MVAIGFTSTSGKLKEQAKIMSDAGIEAYGAAVIDDIEGKHSVIKSSNSLLHIFTKVKRGGIGTMLFQSSEEAETFMKDYSEYLCKGASLDGVKVYSIGENRYLDGVGILYEKVDLFETFVELSKKE